MMGLGLCTQDDYEEVVGWARKGLRLPLQSDDLDWPLFANSPEDATERALIYRANQDQSGWWPMGFAWRMPF